MIICGSMRGVMREHPHPSGRLPLLCCDSDPESRSEGIPVGTVHRLATGHAAGGPTLAAATAAFLDTLQSPGTRRNYAATLRALADEVGPATLVTTLGHPASADQLAAWFTGRWGDRAAATFNRHLDALRSAVGYWHDQGWLADDADPTRRLRRRGRAPDRTKAL